jgi:hypothetical protein
MHLESFSCCKFWHVESTCTFFQKGFEKIEIEFYFFSSEETGPCPKLDLFPEMPTDNCITCLYIGAHMKEHNQGQDFDSLERREAAQHLQKCVVKPEYPFRLAFCDDYGNYGGICVHWPEVNCVCP